MPTLDAHQSMERAKVLYLGDSGSGKTGSLLSLVLAGYELGILDFDDGLDILANEIRAKDPALLKNVSYVTCTDKFAVSAGRLLPTTANAWASGVESLIKWPDWGPVAEWGSNRVLVVDSLNFAGKAAVRHILKLNARLAIPPQIQDYFEAQRLVENFVASICSDHIKCNVIVLTHVREVGKKQESLETGKDGKDRVRTVTIAGTEKGYAETGTGNALSPNIGAYFNNVLLAHVMGSGQGTRRVIRTIPYDNIGLKSSAPSLVKPEYPLATGLAEYFATVRGGVPKGS
jgi:hypothetical protein